MAISDLARKLLWGRAASRCSICRVDLVIDIDLAESTSLIGEECHIVAQSSMGPRGDAAFPNEHVDAYSNLILLCRNHHKEIDDSPEHFSIPYLHLIKKRHEVWVRTTLGIDGGAMPAAISDVLLSRFSLPAVFAFITDWILGACKGVLAVDQPFDVNRRALRLAGPLIQRLIALIPLLPITSESRESLSEFVQDSIGWFFGEARLLLPSEDETSLTRKDELYKDAWDNATANWYRIQVWLLNDPILQYEYRELTISEERWPLLGFSSSEEAWEWLAPTTKTLFDTIGPFELEVLRGLATSGEVDIDELMNQGVPRGVITDTFNRLARDKWAILEGSRIRATPISRKFITRELEIAGYSRIG